MVAPAFGRPGPLAGVLEIAAGQTGGLPTILKRIRSLGLSRGFEICMLELE